MDNVQRLALLANGRSRACGKCPLGVANCTDTIKKICRDAFVEGYKKGCQQARKEQQERIAKVLHPVNEPSGDNQIYLFMRDVRAGDKQPQIDLIRPIDVSKEWDVSTVDFSPKYKDAPKQLQIAWCYPKDLIELLGYDKRFSQFEKIAIKKRWASYSEKEYKENLEKYSVEREQYETFYDYKKRKEANDETK